MNFLDSVADRLRSFFQPTPLEGIMELHRASSNIPDRPLVLGLPLAPGDFDMPTVEGGRAPLAYGYTGVPPGLTISPVTQAVAGVPAQIGVFTITQTVTDADGQQFESNVVIHVLEGEGQVEQEQQQDADPEPTAELTEEPKFDNAYDAAADVVARAGLAFAEAKAGLEDAKTDLAAYELETVAEYDRRAAELQAWRKGRGQREEELGQQIDLARAAVEKTKADRLTQARILRSLLDTFIAEEEAALGAEKTDRAEDEQEAQD